MARSTGGIPPSGTSSAVAALSGGGAPPGGGSGGGWARSGSGVVVIDGLAGGLENGLITRLMDFFVFVDRFTEADVSKVPASVNRLTEVGKGNRLCYSAINRDLSSEALGLARLQKSKTPASQKFYVVVYRTLHTPTSMPPPPTPSRHGIA